MEQKPNIDVNLNSRSQMAVTFVLTDMLIDAVRDTKKAKDDTADYAQVADTLEKLREVVWRKKWRNTSHTAAGQEETLIDLPALDDKAKEAAFNEVIARLGGNKASERVLFEAYARMGELYEVGGLTARENIYKKLPAGAPVSGGIQEFLDDQAKSDDLDTVLKKLSYPVFAPVLTMHPTNIQGLEPQRALRKIGNIIHGKTTEDVSIYGKTTEDVSTKIAELKSAISEYQKTPILHNVDGKEDNLSVRDETKNVLNYLGNIYDDVPGIYRGFDNALSKKFTNYKPLELKLNADISSWGSAGDKDGNDNVTAEKTLEAMVRHTKEIVTRYQAEISQIDAMEQTDWPDKFRRAIDGTKSYPSLNELLEKAEKLTDETDNKRKNNEPISEETKAKFNEISKQLQTLRKDLRADQFERDLKTVYNSNPKDNGHKIVDLIRKVSWFGFGFGKIEYRETAEEHVKIFDKLIDGYSDLTPQERVAKLTDYLQNGITPEMQRAVADILKKGADKSLGDERITKDSDAIAYHTLKRMELARDHPDLIKNIVLAECGALDPEKYPEPVKFQMHGEGEHALVEENPNYAKEKREWDQKVSEQGVANILEAQLLQKLVSNEKDGNAILGVVPLFEDPSTITNVGPIMDLAYKNPAYQEHLEVLKGRNNGEEVTQQVQIAHSDNRRRAGSLAGTAFIHEAHKEIRAASEANGIKIQFFEGGSLADPFRNGVRAISAQVNAYGLQDYAKFTFQGRDLQNYFTHPGSIERLFSRHFVHSASRLVVSDGKLTVDHSGERAPNTIMDEIAIEALKRTKEDYAKEDFSKDAMGSLFAALGQGFDREAKAANRGSRAGMRGRSVTAHVGAVIGVAVDKLRTIPFSMMPQQNRLTLSWAGGQKLEKYLMEEINKRIVAIEYGGDTACKKAMSYGEPGVRAKKELGEFNREFGPFKADVEDNAGRIPPKYIKLLYEKSPTFRDAMDKSAFAVARTDMVAVSEGVEQNLAKSGYEKIRDNVTKYLTKTLQPTFESMGNLVYEAITGKALSSVGNQPLKYARYSDDLSGPKKTWAAAQARMTEALGEKTLGKEIDRKNNYQDFIVHAKDRLGDDDSVLAVLLAGGLTASHSRWLVDDPETAKAKEGVGRY